MRIYLQDRHKEHVRRLGHEPQEHIDCEQHQYFQARALWQETLARTHARVDEALLEEKVIGHLVSAAQSKQKQAELSSQIVIHKHVHRLPWWMILLFLFLGLVFTVPRAHCQFSHINYIQVQNQGSNIGFFTYPFTVNFTGAGVSCSNSAGVVTCSVTGGSITNNPGGSSGQVQYNSSAAFGGISTFTTTGTVQTAKVGTDWNFVDPTDATKAFQFDASAITSATTRTVKVPDAPSAFAQAISLVAHNFLTSFSATTGAFTQAQPAFTDLSGNISTSQMNSGTGASSATFWRGDGTWATPAAGFSNPMTTLGDIIYENATPAAARLAGQTSTVKEYLSQTGTGTLSAVPGWAQINFADIAGTVANSQLHDSYSGVGACSSGNFVSTLNADAAPTCTQVAYANVSGTPSLFYQTVQNASGTAQTQRPTVEYTGTAVSSVVDDAANNRTVVTLTASAGSGIALETGGVNNASQTALNFQNGSTVNGLQIQPSNPSGGNEQMALSGIATVPGGGTGLGTLTAHELYVGNGTSSPNPVGTGTAGQVLISGGAGSDPGFADPVISYNNPSETTAAWSSATANNTVLTVTLPVGTGVLSAVVVTLNQGSTITAGAVTFNVSDTTGFTNAYPIACRQVNVGGLVNTYALQASTNVAFVCNVTGFQAFQVKLSPAISGTGTVNVGIQPTSGPVQDGVAISNNPVLGAGSSVVGKVGIDQSTPGITNAVQATNLPATVDTNTGNASASTPRVVIASNQPNLTTPLNVQCTSAANCNNASVGATGSAVPASATYAAGIGSGATGGNLVGVAVGDTYKPVNISTAATTLLITGVASRQVHITALHLVVAGADNVALIEGTGATCGTGTAGMAGGTTAASGYNFAANGGMTLGTGQGTVIQTQTAGDSVCALTSAAVQLSGGIEYTIY